VAPLRCPVRRRDLLRAVCDRLYRAEPPSGGFARTEVVILDARGDRPEVVLLLLGGHRADAQHHKHRRT